MACFWLWCAWSTDMASSTLAFNDSSWSSICSISLESISNSIPVIFPAKSGWNRWISGKRRSPSICFCSAAGTAAKADAVIRGSCEEKILVSSALCTLQDTITAFQALFILSNYNNTTTTTFPFKCLPLDTRQLYTAHVNKCV